MRMTEQALGHRRRVSAALDAAKKHLALAEASFNAGNHPRYQIADLTDAEAAILNAKGLLS